MSGPTECDVPLVERPQVGGRGALVPLELGGLAPLELRKTALGVRLAPVELEAEGDNHPTSSEPLQDDMHGGKGTSLPSNQSGYPVATGWCQVVHQSGSMFHPGGQTLDVTVRG